MTDKIRVEPIPEGMRADVSAIETLMKKWNIPLALMLNGKLLCIKEEGGVIQE